VSRVRKNRKGEQMYYLRSSINIFSTLVLILISGTAAKVLSVERPPAAAPPPGTEVWGYDPAKGTKEEDIRENFNLHRGRWWNYYERGSWYLAYGYYKEAESDFRTVIKKRSTDKWNARTYGMHFRDCFAHRELGIAIYYQAIQAETKDNRLSLLKESIEQLNQSWKQAESSRTAYYQNLAEEELWKTNGEDVTAPLITIENGKRIGENWAVVICNQSIARIDIHATDYQSGVGTIWVDDERLFLERSGRSIRRTVRMPVNVNDRWIFIRARDLVGNDSTPIVVRVQPDMRPPLILTSTYSDRKAPDDLIVVEYSARDNLGLSTIQIGEQKVSCDGRRQFEDVVPIKTDPDKSHLELRVMDLAGNTTKGFVDLSSSSRSSNKHLNTSFRSERSILMNPRRWANYKWPLLTPAFLPDNTINIAARPLVDERRDTYHESHLMPAMREATSITMVRLPVFEFDDYREVEGGYRVRGNKYIVQGKLKYAADVTGIAVGESTIGFEPRSGENVSLRFSEPVRLSRYGKREITIEALYRGNRVVPHIKPLVIQRVIDPTIEPNSVYAIVVLPLEQEYVPGNSRGVRWNQDMTYDRIKQAFMDCSLYDPNSNEYIPRFDCTAIEQLDHSRIESELTGMSGHSAGFRVLELGKRLRAKKIRVDLGIWGSVRETPNSIEIKLNVVDMETRDSLTAGDPIDIFTPKDKPEWQKLCVDGLASKLVTEIPRVSGKVVSRSDFFKHVTINRGEDDNIMLGTHICIFYKNAYNNAVENIAEATVITLKPHSSIAKIIEGSGGENSFIKVFPGQMFITK